MFELVDKIKMLAREKGVTLETVNRDLGFSENLISSWRHREPSVSSLIKVADYFHVSIDFLLSRIDNETLSPLTPKEEKLLHILRTKSLSDMQMDIITNHVMNFLNFDESEV